MSAGRQFVDGVSGSRPGARRPEEGRGGNGRPDGRRPGPLQLGRWVEDRLDWFLDDGDDWREPWQDPAPARSYGRPAAASSAIDPPAPQSRPPESPPEPRSVPGMRRERRPLEAISRRGLVLPPAAGPQRPVLDPAAPSRPGAAEPGAERPASVESPDSWPDDEDFRLPRWQRPARSGSPPLGSTAAPLPGTTPAAPPGRPLPRSSRRR